MPRKSSEVISATIYQLVGGLDVSQQVRSRYIEQLDFAVEDVAVADRAGVLVTGAVSPGPTKWAAAVGIWTGNEGRVKLGNTTTAAVLLLPTLSPDEHTWAVCFGLGFQLLEVERITPGMGRRLAARCADPERLKSITHSRLDSRAYVARTSIPGGDGLAAYGASDIGDLISRVVGPANLGMMHAQEVKSKNVEIRGADSVRLPLSREPARLLVDLDILEGMLDLPPMEELSSIEQLRVLKSKDPRFQELEDQLDRALDQDGDELGLGWPTEFADVAVPIDHFRVSGAPRGHNGDDMPVELDTVLAPLRGLGDGLRAKRLSSMRVQAFADDNDPASNDLPAKRWIVFETFLSGGRYCLHDGHWYELDGVLNARLSGQAADVFAAKSGLGDLCVWAAGDDEAAYNQRLADHLGGVNLDRQLIQSKTHRVRGFEACDVLTEDGTFIHVKKVDRSAPASHLFSQASVSARTLLDDGTARERLRQKVRDRGGDPAWVPDRVRNVVLVMGRRNEITAESLFSFSRMRLVTLAAEFHHMDISLAVRWVEVSK